MSTASKKKLHKFKLSNKCKKKTIRPKTGGNLVLIVIKRLVLVK